MEQGFILLDEGLQCALPDFIGDLIDALEILEDPFARSLSGNASIAAFTETTESRRIWPSNRLAPKKGWPERRSILASPMAAFAAGNVAG